MSGIYICFICDDECGYYIKNRKNTKKQQALPSVFSLTLGKATIFQFTRKQNCRVQLPRHSAKFETSPSARRGALGKDPNFAECHASGTRWSFKVRRVLQIWHSANFGSLPSATSPALGKVPLPVLSRSSRSAVPFHSFLPSAREKALGIAGFAGRRKAVCTSPSATLGDFFAEYFPAFAECLWHSAKYAWV